jgi:hypothetical protein
MNNMARKVLLKRELAALREKMAQPQKFAVLMADMAHERALEAALKNGAFA